MTTTTFTVAPSVQFGERDVTITSTPTANTVGAYVGVAQWGDVDYPTQITGGETGLVQKFFKPNDDTAIDFFVMSDYLSYSSSAWFCRIAGPLARNAVTKGQTAIRLLNKQEFEGAAPSASITWAGRCVGSLGNDIVIDVADSTTFATWEFAKLFDYAPQPGEFNVVVVDTVGRLTDTAGAVYQKNTVAFSGTATAAGSVSIGGVAVAYASGDTAAQVATKAATALSAVSAGSNPYSSIVAKSNTLFLTLKALGPVAVTVIVNDDKGILATAAITTVGSTGTAITGEKYELLQLTSGSKKSDGSNAYFKDVINDTSSWVYVFADTLAAGIIQLDGGVDDYNVNKTAGYGLYKNAVKYGAVAIIGYGEEISEVQAAIDTSSTRRNTVTFISPPRDAVVNNYSREVESLTAWRDDLLRDNSYFFMDDNWAYIYDKYNDKNRWIPACGGTAGLWARTITQAGIWKSPAFHNRGQYKNYVRMAWSGDSDQRTILYKIQINSIVSFPAEGIILYGDKTGLTRPSAFSRINVRGTFIMAETDISTMAKYFLGENNDAFTRQLFSNAVNPYIRTLKSNGAILDGKFKCDGDNNTADVVSSNQMIAGVWLKPQYSINWIYLDFAAVRPDIEFSEVETNGGIVAAS